MTGIQSFSYVNAGFSLSGGPVGHLLVEKVQVSAAGNRLKYIPAGWSNWREMYTGRHKLTFSGTMRVSEDEVEVIDFLNAAAAGEEVSVTLRDETEEDSPDTDYDDCRVTSADIQIQGRDSGAYVYTGKVVMSFLPSGRSLPDFSDSRWIWGSQVSAGSQGRNEMVLKKGDGEIVPAILKYTEWVWTAARYQVVGDLNATDLGNILPSDGSDSGDNSGVAGNTIQARFLSADGGASLTDLSGSDITWTKEKVQIRHLPEAAMTIVQELWVTSHDPVAYDVVRVHELDNLKEENTGTCEEL